MLVCCRPGHFAEYCAGLKSIAPATSEARRRNGWSLLPDNPKTAVLFQILAEERIPVSAVEPVVLMDPNCFCYYQGTVRWIPTWAWQTTQVAYNRATRGSFAVFPAGIEKDSFLRDALRLFRDDPKLSYTFAGEAKTSAMEGTILAWQEAKIKLVEALIAANK